MNKYTRHTPGPWTIDTEGKVTDLDGRVIAPLVHGHNVPSLAYPRGSGQYIAEDDGGAANARLIAAAPDLLEALEDLEIILSGKPCDRHEHLKLRQVRALIAVTEGREVHGI